jgi:LCP family protein required for cell wall assembly
LRLTRSGIEEGPLRPAATRRAWRPTRRVVFLRRVVLANVFVFTLTACGIAYGYWYENDKVAAIPRETLPVVSVNGGKPMNFLIIGSDSRAFVKSKTDATQFGTSGAESGQRSDTMMVVRVDPKSKQTYVVSFPRDLWVAIPGHGHAKINAAFNNGAAMVIRTLHDDFGIDVNHYLEVDFAGFRNIVNAIGHVHLFFPTIARDRETGLFVTHPGCVALDGTQALAYVRSRHYEYELVAGGPWHEDPTADLGRIRRQQYFMRSLAHDAIAEGLTNPLRANDVVDKVVQDLHADQALDASDLGALVSAFHTTDPAAVEMVTVPTTSGWAGGQSILELRAAAAAPILARLRGQAAPSTGPTTVPNLAPGRVTVHVLNGSGTSGAARGALDSLVNMGFVGDGAADAARFDYLQTEVHAAPGDQATASLVAAYLSVPPKVVSDASVPAGHVVVIVGRDLPGVQRPGTTTSSTSSTVPPNPGSTPGVTVPITERNRPLVGCG